MGGAGTSHQAAALGVPNLGEEWHDAEYSAGEGMSGISDVYFRQVARSVGCPSAFEDDCVQEQRIGIWLVPGVPWKVIARRRAIDFVRTLRRGRVVMVELNESAGASDIEDVDRLMDYRLVLSRLTESQRLALYGQRGNLTYRSQVRKKAREMLKVGGEP